MRPLKAFARILLVLLPFAGATGGSDRAFERPDAVLVNVTERDLNRIVLGSFRANGGPEFRGTKRRVSPAVRDLSYQARVSEPRLELAAGGKLRLAFDVEEANLTIGRLERKIVGRTASCEDAGVVVDPTLPLEVMLGVDLRIEDGDLRIVPSSVSVPDAERRLSLVKPSRCTHAPLPRWLLWWLGKPYLRHYFGNLEEILLARARTSAARIDEQRDLLKRDWQASSGAQLHLFPTALDTSHGSLFLRLAASSAPPGPQPDLPTLPEGLPADRSFLALSQAMTNEVVGMAASRMSVERLKPTGNLGKLVRSGSVYALIPGLRGLSATDTLLYSVVFPSAPTVEFGSNPRGEATIRLLVSDVELRLWKEADEKTSLLGSLQIEAGRVTVVPYRSVLGGVSFRIEENEWTVASKGIRFDDALVAATLQELTFGRIFETSYEPLGTGRLRIGETTFAPQSFRSTGDFLVIELAAQEGADDEPAPRAPRRRDILRASH